MSNSLNALMTKLSWQNNELKAQLELIKIDTQKIRELLETINLNLNQPSLVSLHIHPELEINRLNFITNEYKNKENLLQQLKEQFSVEHSVKEKLQRITTELKMLENYQQREQQKKQIQQRQAQENALDEWVIQKREFA